MFVRAVMAGPTSRSNSWVGADALEALDMLEEAMQETLSEQSHRPGLATATVAVAEGD
jgi:hypothetical protein